ncbi:MAG TPA: TaqI-like C-terminal specificity domain-containing protein, partial [Fibrobacteraceae bacterium]|nr:TaqI-like C-terminal specificity domain-containing protein [Fibrobacteraceae bacterium]
MNKKTFGLREMIILAILLLSCYTIWPSIQIHSKFGEEKIIWIELTDINKFSYSFKEEYLLAGAFFMIGKSLKYLLSYFNSKLCKFYFNLISNSSGMGTTQWK